MPRRTAGGLAGAGSPGPTDGLAGAGKSRALSVSLAAAPANPSYQLLVDVDEPSPIPVAVTRKRVRNLNLRVRRDGSVALSVPWHVSRARAQAFLDEHATWIARTRRRVAERAMQQATEVEREGSVKPGSGRGSGNSTERGIGHASARITTFALWGEERRASSAGMSQDELDALWRTEVARVLPEVVARMEPLVGTHASGWQLRAMTSRWGSCTPKTGRIRINVRLAAYPPECLDYVVAHELAHLIEPSHNARFHAVVARAIPNEREVRARLRARPA